MDTRRPDVSADTARKLPSKPSLLSSAFRNSIDYYWKRWKERDSFKRGYADGGSGLEDLDYLKSS